jgi:hypothetical protein
LRRKTSSDKEPDGQVLCIWPGLYFVFDTSPFQERNSDHISLTRVLIQCRIRFKSFVAVDDSKSNYRFYHQPVLRVSLADAQSCIDWYLKAQGSAEGIQLLETLRRESLRSDLPFTIEVY